MNRPQTNSHANGIPSKATTDGSRIEIADERSRVGFFTLDGELYCNLMFNYDMPYSATREDLCALVCATGEPVVIGRKLTEEERAMLEAEKRNQEHESYGCLIADVPERWRSPRLVSRFYRVLGKPQTCWPLPATQFIQALRECWPEVVIEPKPAPVVGFTISQGELVYPGEFNTAEPSLTLYAPIDVSAVLACWLRDMLPANEPLRLVDHAETFDVALESHMTVADLIAMRTGERLPHNKTATPEQVGASL